MALRIRKAHVRDADAMTALAMRSKQSNGYDDAFMQACIGELQVTAAKLAEAEYWVAEEDGICGMVSLLPSVEKTSAEIGAFFIDPALKRQGIGRRLWEELLAHAKAKGFTLLQLDADPAAVTFYEKLGFETVREVPSGSIPGRYLPQMELTLG